jgi:hypothetical protein
MASTPGFNTGGQNISGQFGMPLYGVAGVLPFTGNYFWVNESSGSDGNTGGPQDPFATLTQALSRCTSGNSDVVFLVGSVHVTATVAWNLNNTHLIGLTAPSNSDRARISSTGVTGFSPLVNVTGNGCMFKNIGTFHGGFTGATGSQVCWAENGGRNFYENCQFYGGGDATTAALAGMRSLTIGSDENLFHECTIGLDTIVRATNVNASLEFVAGVSAKPARNILRQCVFQALVSDTADLHVLCTALDRFALFERCSFLNAVNSTGSTMAVAITAASPGASGSVLLQYCSSVGATAMATSGPVYVDGAVPVATTTAIAVLAT